MGKEKRVFARVVCSKVSNALDGFFKKGGINDELSPFVIRRYVESDNLHYGYFVVPV